MILVVGEKSVSRFSDKYYEVSDNKESEKLFLSFKGGKKIKEVKEITLLQTLSLLSSLGLDRGSKLNNIGFESHNMEGYSYYLEQ